MTSNEKLVAIALNYKEKNKTATPLNYFYNKFSKTAKQLVNNPNLIISKPDKGSGVVILLKKKLGKNECFIRHQQIKKVGPSK